MTNYEAGESFGGAVVRNRLRALSKQQQGVLTRLKCESRVSSPERPSFVRFQIPRKRATQSERPLDISRLDQQEAKVDHFLENPEEFDPSDMAVFLAVLDYYLNYHTPHISFIDELGRENFPIPANLISSIRVFVGPRLPTAHDSSQGSIRIQYAIRKSQLFGQSSRKVEFVVRDHTLADLIEPSDRF